MICPPCRVRNHEECKERNKEKPRADCDCQHRIPDKKDEADGAPQLGD